MFFIFPQWSIDAEPPKHKDVGPLTFGLLFVPEFAASTLEKGPQADHPEVRGALLVLSRVEQSWSHVVVADGCGAGWWSWELFGQPQW